MKNLTKTSKEIILCFQFQYFDRYKKYNELFFEQDIIFTSQKKIQEGILVYCNFIEDMQFLIDLIFKEEAKLK